MEYASAPASNGCDESIALQLLDGLCNAGHTRPERASQLACVALTLDCKRDKDPVPQRRSEDACLPIHGQIISYSLIYVNH